MKAKTRLFGTIDIADEKIITMEKGMIGFPELTHFALIFDEDKKAALDSGMNGFISKPVVVEDVVEALQEVFNNNIKIL